MRITAFTQFWLLFVIIFSLTYALHGDINVQSMSTPERVQLCRDAQWKEIETTLLGNPHTTLAGLLTLDEQTQKDLVLALLVQIPNLYPILYDFNQYHCLSETIDTETFSYHAAYDTFYATKIEDSNLEIFIRYLEQAYILPFSPIRDIRYIIASIYYDHYHIWYAAQIYIAHKLYTIIGVDLGNNNLETINVIYVPNAAQPTFANDNQMTIMFKSHQTYFVQPIALNDPEEYATLKQMLFLLMLQKRKEASLPSLNLYQPIWNYMYYGQPHEIKTWFDIINSFATPRVSKHQICAMLAHAGYIQYNQSSCNIL